MTSRLLVGCTVAVAAAVLTPALAEDPPDFTMMWDASADGIGESFYNWDLYGSTPVFGDHTLGGEAWTGWKYEGALSGQNSEWSLSWTCVFNDDTNGAVDGGGAFVAAYIVVTNNFGSTQNFQSQSNLSLTGAIDSPLMRGEVSGTVSDLNFNSATVSAPFGGQIYTPQIDGIDESDGFMLADPFSATAGALQQAPVGPETFGIPSPLSASRNAISSIGLLLDFDLSPGDSVQINAYFELMPVPGAGGLGLLAALGLVTRRRRR